MVSSAAMMKSLSATAILLTFLLFGSRVHAQESAGEFGSANQLVLAAERLFGYVHTSDTSTTVNGSEQTTKVDSFAILSSPLSIATVYSAPRLSLDYFVSNRLSLGLAASFFKVTQEIPGVMDAFEPTYSGFLFAPRAGFGVPLSPLFAVWPRFGLTIMHLSLETTSGGVPGGSNDTTVYGLTIEVPFLLTIAPHLFLSFGPTLDLGVGGSSTTSNAAIGPDNSGDRSATSFGLQFSLGGYF
jgi:hypothetical protein